MEAADPFQVLGYLREVVLLSRKDALNDRDCSPLVCQFSRNYQRVRGMNEQISN